MPIFRTGLAAAAAALLAGAAAVAATPAYSSASTVRAGASTARAEFPGDSGVATLFGSVDLPPSGAWTNTPLMVRLPRAGTYELDADVRGRLAGAPPLNTYMTARLWNTTEGNPVPNSERLVYQIIDLNPGDAGAGGNETAPISELITVSGPTTIRLQAQDNNATGMASIAQVYSDGSGYTTLRYVRAGL